jgi:hypothetical protein
MSCGDTINRIAHEPSDHQPLRTALLAEYRAVLVRPKLCKLHGLSVEEIALVLTDLARHAIVLAARPDLVLITGDKRLAQNEVMPQRVISPQTYLAQLQH